MISCSTSSNNCLIYVAICNTLKSFYNALRYILLFFQLKKQAKERERQDKKETKEKEKQARAQAREKIKMSKDKEKLLKKVCLFIYLFYFIIFISHKKI